MIGVQSLIGGLSFRYIIIYKLDGSKIFITTQGTISNHFLWPSLPLGFTFVWLYICARYQSQENLKAFIHNEILYFVGPESVAELICSSDDHRSYFLLCGSQDFADFEEIQFVQFTKMSISHEPFELYPWSFAGILKMSLTSPTNLPAEKMKKWHNFWMSLPIWMKFCMNVVEEYLHN